MPQSHMSTICCGGGLDQGVADGWVQAKSTRIWNLLNDSTSSGVTREQGHLSNGGWKDPITSRTQCNGREVGASRLQFLAILSHSNAENQDSQSLLAALLKPGYLHHFSSRVDQYWQQVASSCGKSPRHSTHHYHWPPWGLQRANMKPSPAHQNHLLHTKNIAFRFVLCWWDSQNSEAEDDHSKAALFNRYINAHEDERYADNTKEKEKN